MDKNKTVTFKYGYTATVLTLTVIAVLFGICLVTSIIFRLWGLLAISLFLSIMIIIGLVFDGALYPIYISDRHVGFRGKKYLWKDIKITLTRSAFDNRYNLIIGTSLGRDKKTIKRQKKLYPCIYLKNTKILDMILPYYNSKLTVLSSDGVEETPVFNGTNKKIGAVITEHNFKYKK